MSNYGTQICQQFHLDKFSRNAEFKKVREETS